ncbi:transcription initiation factor IIF subunit alpha-like isoform X2 [Salvia splendens]|nr:transcription initiation factor IIF subunit alpha-like isoform X2 [Salvia splendens]
MLQGKEFVAIPAGSWYNFNKVAQYKQLTLEEAEEKMNNRRKTADGYQRWMMKAANNGATAFGEVEKFDNREGAAGGGRGRKKTTGDDDEANASDRGEEDEDEESARRSRLGLNKKSGDDDEGLRGGDLDFDDDDIEKGDDWEHEEIFTDDDEAVGIDPEEREDLAPEIPAPPEIKQDDEDEDEADEEDKEGGLSKSGKELKKLLGRANGLNDSDSEDDDDDDDDADDDISPGLTPKKEAPKEEPVHNNTPLKATNSTAGRGTPPTSKSSKGKRKVSNEDLKTPNSSPLKKVKPENETKVIKDENVSSSKGVAHPKGATPPASSKSVPAPATGPVTEDEIRAVLLPKTPVTTKDLLAKFRSRLKTKEEKDAFSGIMKRISKIQKTNGATNYVVLRDNLS